MPGAAGQPTSSTLLFFPGANETMGLQRYACFARCIPISPKSRLNWWETRPWKGKGLTPFDIAVRSCVFSIAFTHIHASMLLQVFKNKKMAGHMGAAQRTIENVWVLRIEPARSLMWVKGQVII